MKNFICNIQEQEMSEIYNKYLVKHFPENERKPLENIKSMWDCNQYFALAMYTEEKKLAGYAFFVRCEDTNLVLLDYFAILEEYRRLGLGGTFLQFIVEQMKEFSGILIETEDIECAKNEEEEKERLDRNRFYLENGAVLTGIKNQVYDARYEIYELPLKDRKSDEEILRALDMIYKVIVPGEKNLQNVRIWKK